MLPDKLLLKLAGRYQEGTLRNLSINDNNIDFTSNDYLGFARLPATNTPTDLYAATGSRLLSGNSTQFEQLEQRIAQYHQVEHALLFNSGYDANLGLISCIAQRDDLILYDELVHASIRDGIQLSLAKSLKYRHNDLDHLNILLDKLGTLEHQQIYVITESVFSMDGDLAPIQQLTQLTQQQPNTHLIIDEAHALGVVGDRGCGLVQHHQLQDAVFARIITYGKAMGCHGAAILGSYDLTQYLINFCRTFIYTTALPPHALYRIDAAYNRLIQPHDNIAQLQQLIKDFNTLIIQHGLRLRFRESVTPIQICIIPGNHHVKHVATQLQQQGFDVKAIVSPTVKPGQERLRICLHSYNSLNDCKQLLQIIATHIKK